MRPLCPIILPAVAVFLAAGACRGQTAPTVAVPAEAPPGDAATASPLQPSTTWSYAPDPAPAVTVSGPPVTIAARGDDFPLGDGFPAKLSAPDKAIAIITHAGLTRLGNEAPPSPVMEWLNLKTGHSLGKAALPANSCVTAISPDATRVAVSPALQPGRDTVRLDILDLTAHPPRSLLAFEPFGNEEPLDRQIAQSVFVDATHLLTVNSSINHKMIMWELGTTPKVLWAMKAPALGTFHGPVFSPTNKYMLLEDTDGFTLYDPLTGKGAGFIPFPVQRSEHTTSNIVNLFNPDGRTLAHLNTYDTTLISLDSDPKVLATIPNPPDVRMQKAAWVNPQMLLLNGKYLLDTDKQMVVWTYDLTAHDARAALFGDRLWILTRTPDKAPPGQSPTLSEEFHAVELPDSKTRAALGKLDPATLFAAGPGSKVTLRVAASKDAAKNAKIAEQLTKQLVDNGYVIADGQPIVLDVSTTVFPSRAVTYVPAGRPGPARQTAVAPDVTRVSFLVNGQAAWTCPLYSPIPMRVPIAPGQTVASAVAAAKARQTEGFDLVILPKRIPVPRDPPGFGRTDLGH